MSAKTDPSTDAVHIYVLRDPRSNEVRYVGATTNPEHRLFSHIHLAREYEAKQREKGEWIRELLAIGKKPIIETIEIVERSKAYDAETKWIEHYCERTSLLNIMQNPLLGTSRYYTESSELAVGARPHTRKCICGKCRTCYFREYRRLNRKSRAKQASEVS